MLRTDVPFLAEPMSRDGAQSIKQILRLGRRHLLLFLIVMIGTMLLGFSVLLLLKPSYTALATVAITTQNADPLAPGGQPQVARLEDDVPATEAAKLQSRDVAAAVVREIPPPPAQPDNGLAHALCGYGVKPLCGPKVVVPLTAEQKFQQQVDGVLNALKILPEPRSRVIDVSATASTGERAAAIANATVTSYQHLALAQQTADVDRVAAWLDARTNQLRQRWLDAVHTADSFNVSHDLANTGDGTSANPLIDSQITEITLELSQAQARLAAAQARAGALLDAKQHGNARSAVTLSQQPLLVAAANSLLQLQTEREQQAAQFGSNYPGIRALDRQIASTRAILNNETGSALASVRADSISAQGEVRALNARLADLRARAGLQSSPQAEYRTLGQEAQSAREVYETFLEHSKAVVDRAALLQPPLVFISHAIAPTQPSFPNHLKLGLGIVVVALVFASAAVVLRSYFAAEFADTDYLRSVAQLPLLGKIPMITRRRNQPLARFVLDEPRSRVSEVVRGLAVQLFLGNEKNDEPMAVLITSATPQEGKSTLAMWLGLTVGQSGPRILMIDSDHRKGSPGNESDVAMLGFTDLVAGRARVDEVIQTDSTTKIDFITAGASVAYPIGTASVARMRSLIATLKLSYDMVIIDGSPVLATSDVLALAAIVDRTVFLCRWQQTSRQAVITSLERLRSCGAHVAGIVVSMVGKKVDSQTYEDFNRRELALIDRFYGS